MSKFYVSLLLSLAFGSVKSQVVFCPPGAIWNSSFVNLPAFGGIYNYINEQIVYQKDTVIANDTVKILRHRFYYTTCYNNFSQIRTYIKQNGDTIFFSNARTQNTWQILFNYAATPGNGWQSNVLKANNTFTTYNYVVDSVSQIVVNGFNLKCLYLQGRVLTERYGFAGFIFQFPSYSGCDGYYLNEALCYSDSAFGTLSFSQKPCNYSGSVNINSIVELNSETQFLLYPNPVLDKFTVQLLNETRPPTEIILRNTLGQVILHFNTIEQKTEIDLSPFSNGIYFLDIKNGFGNQRMKLVKE